MGLTLHFELRVAGDVSPARIDDLLGRLREFAARGSFALVTELVPYGHFDAPPNDVRRLIDFWSMLHAEGDEEAGGLQSDPAMARGFVILPGKGCEPAIVALMPRHTPSGRVEDWWWQCSCKTQYASNEGDEHFLHCHTALVALLDHAMELGIEVDVVDEGRFWDTRDPQLLLDELHRMNTLIAQIAGQLSDQLGAGHPLEAPIFDHPRFEHLEMGDED